MIFQERILSNEHRFFDCITMNKRSNFTKPPKAENVEKSRKTDRIENRVVVKNLSLAENKALDLKQLIQYQLTDVFLW